MPSEVHDIRLLETEEWQRSIRALLRHPLIVADDPELSGDFARIRRQAEALKANLRRRKAQARGQSEAGDRPARPPAAASGGDFEDFAAPAGPSGPAGDSTAAKP